MSKELAVTKNLSKTEHVRQTIKRMKPGTIFFAERFPDIEKPVMRVILHRLVKEDFIERVAHRIYRKPKYSEVLKLQIPAGTEDIVKAIAKRDGLKFDRTPQYALNRLGFSQQVVTRAVYVSNGPPRIIHLSNGRRIKMNQTSSKNLAYRNKLMQALVHALKALGLKHIHKEELRVTRSVLEMIPEKDLLADLHLAPKWIQKLLMDLYSPQPTF